MPTLTMRKIITCWGDGCDNVEKWYDSLFLSEHNSQGMLCGDNKPLMTVDKVNNFRLGTEFPPRIVLY